MIEQARTLQRNLIEGVSVHLGVEHRKMAIVT